MYDVIETAALALIFGALLRILRLVQERHEETCVDADDMLDLEFTGELEDRRVN